MLPQEIMTAEWERICGKIKDFVETVLIFTVFAGFIALWIFLSTCDLPHA